MFMHARGGDEKCQVFLHKPTFEIMTFHVILFEQHYCLSKKINKKLKTLHASNCIPTIVGDTAPPAGCSQYLTGTSGSFYRLFKTYQSHQSKLLFRDCLSYCWILIFPIQSQLWREPAPCGLGLQVIFHRCRRHYFKHQHQQNHLT